MRYLGQYVTEIDIRTDSHWDNGTPLHEASLGGHLEVVRYLIEKGANPKLKTKAGKTAYDIAVDEGHSSISMFLKQSIGKYTNFH